MAKRNNQSDERCAFCGEGRPAAKELFAAMEPDVFICDECIERGHGMVTEMRRDSRKGKAAPLKMEELLKPAQIKEFLDGYVIGQEQAKRYISVAVYNHYKRLVHTQQGGSSEIELEKSNIIMVGPTGTGKTLLARSIARLLKVPFAMADATALTEAGYVGEDVEGILAKLYQASGYDLELTQRGIVFIDEIDKIARKGDNPSITRDVSGEGVQQAMLKVLEGAVVNVPPEGGRKHPEQKFIQIDTSNILFICGGAFDGVEKKIAARLNTNVVGYGQINRDEIDRDNLMQHIMPQDLKSFGLIPELIGRLPVLTYLDPLGRQALRSILTEPRNAIVKQYVKLMEIEGIELSFEEEVLDMIVEKSMEFNLGARGLRSICETIMMDAMFEMPSEGKGKIIVTRDYAEGKMSRMNLTRLRSVG